MLMLLPGPPSVTWQGLGWPRQGGQLYGWCRLPGMKPSLSSVFSLVLLFLNLLHSFPLRVTVDEVPAGFDGLSLLNGPIPSQEPYGPAVTDTPQPGAPTSEQVPPAVTPQCINHPLGSGHQPAGAATPASESESTIFDLRT